VGFRPFAYRLARELGIEWHLLTEGDAAGEAYARQAMRFVRDEPAERRITVLPERDIENCFYEHGYAALFRRMAGGQPGSQPGGQEAGAVIRRAIERHPPLLALGACWRRRADRPACRLLLEAIEVMSLTREGPCTTQTHLACARRADAPPDLLFRAVLQPVDVIGA
jgi:hypothetical protein